MKRTALKRGPGPARRTPIKRWSKREIPDQLLDDLAREIVFHRDGYRCARCDKPCEQMVVTPSGKKAYLGLQWAHVYSRNKKSLRWNPEGAMCLCGGCHLFWHHRPIDAIAWFEGKYPERHRRLKLLAATPQKLDRALILADLRQRWLQTQIATQVGGATPEAGTADKGTADGAQP